MADLTVEEAVERNCQALISGNIGQLFTDMAPEAMAKIAAAGGAGAAMAGGMPTFAGYEIVSRAQDGEDHIYDVHFNGSQSFGVKARWRQVNDQWKLVDFDGYPL